MRFGILVLLVAGAGCTPPPPAATPAPASAPLPSGLHWFRNSAEQRAAFRQAYLLATERLRQLAPAEGAWAVVLDADETVLDNSPAQLRQARAGRGYDPAAWNVWVRERAAAALPGSLEFTRAVHEMGGRVVIVSNRDAEVCDDTRANLQALGIPADMVLCRAGESDKNARFQAVAAGTAGLPPLRIVMWVGDNIQDFPGGSQALRDAPAEAFSRFGRDWIILPNPMYGSWERNPEM